MEELKIIYKNVKDITPYKNNPRENDNAVEIVATSIKEFGFKVPIILDKDNEIIAGHTRLKAALQLGLKKVPCIIAEDLDDAQIKAFRIADNKTAEFSSWDMGLLKIELEELQSMNFDINLTGFIAEEIAENIEPYDIEELLSELDTSSAAVKPIWASIRTDAVNKEKLEAGLKLIEKYGIRVERNYD